MEGNEGRMDGMDGNKESNFPLTKSKFPHQNQTFPVKILLSSSKSYFPRQNRNFPIQNLTFPVKIKPRQNLTFPVKIELSPSKTKKDGKKDGFWKILNENGQIESVQKYNNGELRSIFCSFL